MLFQPGPHLALALHARLQLLQYRDARLDGGGAGHGRLQCLLCRATLGLHLGLPGLQLGLLLRRAGFFFLRGRQFHGQAFQLFGGFVAQLVQRGLQPLAALLHLRQCLFVRAALDASHLQCLLGVAGR